MNSYWVGEDGNYKYFEILLIDPVLNTVDSQTMQKGRAFRGLTSQGRKSRGGSDRKGSKRVKR